MACGFSHCTRWPRVESIFKNGLKPGLAAGTSGPNELQFAPFLPFDEVLRTRASARGRAGASDHDILLARDRDGVVMDNM
eukprot:862082-Lingulodinium_polyedra.AAC.1